VAAATSTSSKLIEHPRFGKGCKAFKDKVLQAEQFLCALIDKAQHQGVISALEAQQAYDMIAQQPSDGAYLDEWAQLMGQCML
jgi:hypothetical protein